MSKYEGEHEIDLDDLSKLPIDVLVFFITEFVLELEKRYSVKETKGLN